MNGGRMDVCHSDFKQRALRIENWSGYFVRKN